MKIGKWAEQAEHFETRGDFPTFAQISGGRTSAMMAALCPPNVQLLFQNTGREHPGTYEFLARLQDGLKRPITWLEFRPPDWPGKPPKEFRFAVVTYETAARDGTPFREALRALAAYRATKGEPPVSPWARQRLCTSYLKHKVKDRYVRALGHAHFETFVGLRWDEPFRVERLLEQETTSQIYRAPLFNAHITKQDVADFWRAQSFDLEIEEHQGNCTGCFLKDEADLVRVLNEPETDADWWDSMRKEFPDFGGRTFQGYAELRAEYEQRCRIEEALGVGQTPINLGGMDDRRFRNVVKQERKRMFGEREHLSCACEGTQLDMDLFI